MKVGTKAEWELVRQATRWVQAEVKAGKELPARIAWVGERTEHMEAWRAAVAAREDIKRHVRPRRWATLRRLVRTAVHWLKEKVSSVF